MYILIRCYFLFADKPSVEASSEYVMVGEGESAHLDCKIDANPLDESMVKWTHAKLEKMAAMESRTSRSFQDTKSYLTILQVTANDSGLYTCTVNNKIGQPANASIYLIVKRKENLFSYIVYNLRHIFLLLSEVVQSKVCFHLKLQFDGCDVCLMLYG